MLHQHMQSQHSQTWLIELSTGWLPHRQHGSVSEQVLAQILKSCAYHPNLVLCYHFRAICGWYLAFCCCTYSNSTPTPTLRSTELFSSLALGPEGQQHQAGGTQPPSTSLILCLLPHDGEGITAFVSSAQNDLCRLIKPSLSWDQSCLKSDHSLGRAPWLYIHPQSISQQRQIQAPCGHCADGYDPAHLAHSHESSLNKQVFISGNATRIFLGFFSPLTIKRGISSRNHKNFLGNSLCPTSILLHSSWHGERMKMGDGKISACFLLTAFADSEIWGEQQEVADSIT